MSASRRHRALGLTLSALALTALAAAPGGAGASAAGKSAAVGLRATNGSVITGRVRIEQFDGYTALSIAVAGSSDPLLPFIHRGTCMRYGPQPAIPLALVTAEAPSMTTIDIPFDALMSGGYVVDLHIARGTIASLLDPRTSVACGVLETTAPAVTATPPAELTAIAPLAGTGPLANARVAPLTLDLLVAAGGACTLSGLRLRAVHRRDREVMR